MKWLLFATLVVASLDLGQSYVIYEEVPFEDSFYELECPHPGNFEYWLLHGKGDALRPVDTGVDVFTYEEKMTVYSNGSIIFESLKIEHAGVHLCVRSNNNMIKAHEVPLQVRPLPSKNPWGDIYQAKFFTGLVAALVCFTLFALSCLVYNKRWRPAEKPLDVRPIIGNGYDNPAMVPAEDDASSTKM